MGTMTAMKTHGRTLRQVRCSATLLASCWLLANAAGKAPAGTELVSDGRLVFRANTRVTFAATYVENAVKATVSSKTPADLLIHTGRRPRNVFIGLTRLTVTEWKFDTDAKTVSLTVPAGTHDLQLRFDDIETLAPFKLDIPVVACGKDWRRGAGLGMLQATCADDRTRGALAWPGQAGFYRLRPRLGDSAAPKAVVTVPSSAANEDGEYLLCAGTVITVNGPMQGRLPPLDCLEVQLVAEITEMARVPRNELDFSGSVVLEGEAFTAEGGGTIKKSRDHQNTHGGGCIFTWANPGHWIRWDFEAPAAGKYILTFVGATAQEQAIRSLKIDDTPVPGAALVTFTKTGGWGRSNPEEWQAFRPIIAARRPVVVELTKGKHSLRMANLIGQHLNIDVILLTPQP